MTDQGLSGTAGDFDRGTLLALLEASRAINDQLEPDEACRLVASHAATVLNTESASVLLYDEPRQELVFQTVIDPDNSDIVEGHRFSADIGIAGQVIRTGRSVCVDDVRDNRNFYSGVDQLTETSTRNLMAVPLVHQGTTLGVLEVVNRRAEGPFQPADLKLLEVFANLVAGAARHAQLFEQLKGENRGLRADQPVPQFIGTSPAFAKVLELCRKVASSTTTVLLGGETGTGKEMAARAIHSMSPRCDRPFVAVNCAALPESLIESELFGHEAGAFTGATSRRSGRFELADRGTLLLDEIGELDLPLQATLLRVLESAEFMPVGGTQTMACDVRVIVATHRDLKAEVEAGRFREDLFYRLSVFPIRLPALRERVDDLPLLIEHLIAQVIPSMGVPAPEMTEAALQCMQRYRWPGNVRELRNVIERAVLLAEGEVRPEHLPPEVASAAQTAESSASCAVSALAEQEHRIVLEALEENDWNQSAAARALGITRDILRYRVKRYGLQRPR